jgi:hypothetical protein
MVSTSWQQKVFGEFFNRIEHPLPPTEASAWSGIHQKVGLAALDLDLRDSAVFLGGADQAVHQLRLVQFDPRNTVVLGLAE